MRGRVRALAAGAALALLLVAAVPAGAQEGAPKSQFRLGWAQEPQTLNPFIDQDEEDFVIWAINWRLLVDFGTKDLGPVPGIAQSWQVSPEKKTVTFKLFANQKWSDGQPITSDDVKYSFETFAPNSLLFGSYVDAVDSIDTPDPLTVVLHLKKPDARIVGGLFAYVLPKHVWGKESVKSLTTSYKPSTPMVGSGPYVVTQFQRGRIIRMQRNPYYRGPKGQFDELQFIKYGNADAVDRALRLGEVDYERDVTASAFVRLEKTKGIKAIKSPSPSFTELSFNLCNKTNCPDAKFNPGVQDVVVRQAIAYAVDRNRINQIASRDTSFAGHGLLPQYYTSFYAKPEQDYPYDVAKANQLLDAAGYKRGGDGIRAKGPVKLSFNLAVRSESQDNIQAARLVAEMAKQIGVNFKVQIMSVDKLTEITTQKKKGKMAPDFDTFIWGWGGDPYDPSLLLNLLTTKAIGGSSDSFYSNPEYDALYDQQAGEFDSAKRKQLVSQMIALSQRDLPYIVLTVDPVLQAYRTDRLAPVKGVCPSPGGDGICEQVSGAPFVSTISPPVAAAKAPADEGGSSALPFVLIAIAIVIVAVLVFVLRRRRGGGDREPVELEV
jgi:peptide/nickel transport system substrate-binding protein